MENDIAKRGLSMSPWLCLFWASFIEAKHSMLHFTSSGARMNVPEKHLTRDTLIADHIKLIQNQEIMA